MDKTGNNYIVDVQYHSGKSITKDFTSYELARAHAASKVVKARVARVYIFNCDTRELEEVKYGS